MRTLLIIGLLMMLMMTTTLAAYRMYILIKFLYKCITMMVNNTFQYNDYIRCIR